MTELEYPIVKLERMDYKEGVVKRNIVSSSIQKLGRLELDPDTSSKLKSWKRSWENEQMIRENQEPQVGIVSTSTPPKRRRSSRNPEVDNIFEEAIKTKKISRSHQHDLPKSFATSIVSALHRLPPEFELEKLKLRDCGISVDFLTILLNGAKSRRSLVNALDLSGNKNLDMKVVKSLMSFYKSVELDLSGTESARKQIRVLGDMKIKILKLKYTAFEDGAITKTLIKLLNNGLEKLVLDDCEISDQQLGEIAESMKPISPLKHLDMSHVNLKKKGIEAISQILSRTNGMEKVILTDCGLCEESLKILAKSAIKKISDLTISSNPEITKTGVKAVAELAEKVKCSELDISSNNFTGRHVKDLLSAAAPKQVETLYIGESFFDNWSDVARLVVHWGVQTLDITECRMKAEDVKTFAESLGMHQMKCLNLSHPDEIKITEEKQKALEKLRGKSSKVIFGNHEEWMG